MLKANDRFDFHVRTNRKGERFSLEHSGQLTVTEDVSRKELFSALVEGFLEDINSRASRPYARNEVVATISIIK